MYVSRETLNTNKTQTMALTNSERQAALKARREEMTRLLAEQNSALLEENAALRAEVAALTDKAHKLEIATLKAQLKQAQNEPQKGSKR